MKENQAVVALCKCKEGKRPFGIRFGQYENKWLATWAYALKKDESSSHEKYDSVGLSGDIGFGEDYPGCPYCGSKGIVVCSSCGGLNCDLNSQNGLFSCAWCGMTGELGEYSGASRISTKSDR